MAQAPSIPPDLIDRARALGADTLDLVLEAYQRATEETRTRVLHRAISACEEEGVNRAEGFVDLSSDEMDAVDTRFSAMVSPTVGAYHEGAAEAVAACCARLQKLLDDSPARSPH